MLSDRRAKESLARARIREENDKSRLEDPRALPFPVVQERRNGYQAPTLRRFDTDASEYAGHATLSNCSSRKTFRSGLVLDGIPVSCPWGTCCHLGFFKPYFVLSPGSVPSWFSRATLLAVGDRRGSRLGGICSRALVCVAGAGAVLSGARCLATGNVARLDNSATAVPWILFFMVIGR